MSSRLVIHSSPEAEKPYVELLKKRDAKLVKRAIGKHAASSLRSRTVKDSLSHQNPNHGIELEKRQIETVQEALGKLATEKGLRKLPQRFRSRRLAKKLNYARKELH